MDSKQEAFLKELMADFRIEAAEHYQAIVQGLIELEQNPAAEQSVQLIERTFRELHSLKGAARAVSLPNIERLCQSAESVFHSLKEQKISPSPPLFDVFHHVMDTLQILLMELEKEEKTIRSETIRTLQRSLERCLLPYPSPATDIPVPPSFQPEKQRSEISTPSTPDSFQPERNLQAGSVRIPTRKLNAILNQVEELISAKSYLHNHITDLRDIHSRDESLYRIYNNVSRFQRSFVRMIDNLLLNMKSTLLYPFSSILEMMPKLVRDLAREQGKEISFNISGKETEIDRRILEEMKDPLIHLIRNCIDHGLETPEERTKNGKPPIGSLSITITQETNQQVIIKVSDDGAGILKDKVIGSAIRNHVISREESVRLTSQEIFALIFRSGVSTSLVITDLSGRGLGMAIVSEKVLKLGGAISIESVPGKGTTFTIQLPLTLSTFRGIPVRVQDLLFIIPTHTIARAIRIRPSDIRTIKGKPVIPINGTMIGLVYLNEVMNIPYIHIKKENVTTFPALVMENSLHRIAFVMDEVMGEQEGIVKDLIPILGKIKHIAGVTIMGNGKIVPVLNVPELIETATFQNVSTSPDILIERMTPKTEALKSILVAEDSITARSLIRNILESAGYVVKTVVDGKEALDILRKESFDLVVSDVEMPRMNGFELTARIRGDQAISELPVILVTALESADDRQRGLEAGANAYITKSSFEQSNLIDTIHRLI